LRALEGGRSEMHTATVNRLSVYEGIAANCSHRVDVMRIHVIDVVNVRVVEDIRVANVCVPDIDAFNELVTAVEPRVKRFAIAQREPTHAEAEASTEETDESGPVDRRTKNRAWAPAPPAREIVPAAIVVRRETPRRIVDPGPAPRADPVPIARAVGSPAGRNFARVPNVAVFGFITPVAVIIQIAVARSIARNVLAGNGVVFFQVTLGGPAVQAIRTRRFLNAVLNVVGAIELRALIGMNFIGLAAGGDFAVAANDRHAGRVAVLIYVNAECSRLFNGES
jgi:hypothetical protein